MKGHDISPDWKLFERRPTWSCVNSRELSQALRVSAQALNNWLLRDILPAPILNHRLKGNKNWYKISTIRSWLENRTEDEIHWEWVRKYVPLEVTSLEEAQFYVRHCYDLYGVEKPLV